MFGMVRRLVATGPGRLWPKVGRCGPEAVPATGEEVGEARPLLGIRLRQSVGFCMFCICRVLYPTESQMTILADQWVQATPDYPFNLFLSQRLGAPEKL